MPGTGSETITEVAAEAQDRALAVVQRLLQERGIHARCHHTIGLGLYANRMDGVVWPDRPALRSWTERYPPELIVTGSRGWREATVTVGPRPGCYLVSLRDGPEPRTVGEERPEKVVELILVAGQEVTV